MEVRGADARDTHGSFGAVTCRSLQSGRLADWIDT